MHQGGDNDSGLGFKSRLGFGRLPAGENHRVSRGVGEPAAEPPAAAALTWRSSSSSQNGEEQGLHLEQGGNNV